MYRIRLYIVPEDSGSNRQDMKIVKNSTQTINTHEVFKEYDNLEYILYCMVHLYYLLIFYFIFIIRYLTY